MSKANIDDIKPKRYSIDKVGELNIFTSIIITLCGCILLLGGYLFYNWINSGSKNSTQKMGDTHHTGGANDNDNANDNDIFKIFMDYCLEPSKKSILGIEYSPYPMYILVGFGLYIMIFLALLYFFTFFTNNNIYMKIKKRGDRTEFMLSISMILSICLLYTSDAADD